jgi:hypothetical protein
MTSCRQVVLLLLLLLLVVVFLFGALGQPVGCVCS